MSWKIGICLLLVVCVQADKPAKDAAKDPQLIKCEADNGAQQEKISSLKSQVDTAGKLLAEKEKDLALLKKVCEAKKAAPKKDSKGASDKVILISYDGLKDWVFHSWDIVKRASCSTFDRTVTADQKKMIGDQYEKLQAQRRKMVDELMLAAQPHVGEHIETVKTLYNTHAATHVDMLWAKAGQAAAAGYSMASDQAAKMTVVADEFIQNKAKAFSQNYPSAASFVPSSSVDVMLTLLLVNGLVVGYFFLGLKALSYGWSFSWWCLRLALSIVFFPCTLCCGKRSEKKESKKKVFTVPTANGKAPASGKKGGKKKD